MNLDPIETSILALAEARGPGKSVCPGEVARALRPEGWQALLAPVRQAAKRFSAAGRLDILRHGRPVSGDAVRGVVRLRIRPGTEGDAS